MYILRKGNTGQLVRFSVCDLDGHWNFEIFAFDASMIRLEESKCGFVFWDQEPSNYTWFSWNDVQHMKKLMKWLLYNLQKKQIHISFLANSNPSRHVLKVNPSNS